MIRYTNKQIRIVKILIRKERYPLCKVIKENNPTLDEFDTNKIYSQPMRVAVAKSTGMDNSDEVMMSEINLERWKDKK